MEFSDILTEYSEEIQLKQGDFFVEEGKRSTKIGYVSSGLLHSYQIDQKGNQVTTNFFSSGNYCGSFYAFYCQKPALDSIEAINDVRMHIISFDRLHELFESSLELNQIGRKSIEEVCIQKDLRLSQMLKMSATERYLSFVKSHPEVIKYSPLKYIASYLGMKPESLSRIRREIIS